MGVKNVWEILSPYSVRKPIAELAGQTVGIDLAGWVCESMSVATNAQQTHLHLKNLFFRTCYLLWNDITPLFVLEGNAPVLKSQTMEKRNKLQNRTYKQVLGTAFTHVTKSYHERKRFDYVLNQCANLLETMGIRCVRAPGEAEAFCAYLNKLGHVNAVISHDSDCFAYGARMVYKNFSVSSQGAGGGAYVDVYDLNVINDHLQDFGQNKFIAMALLCGCDYLPEGVPGVGRENALRFLNMYPDFDVLPVIRAWRSQDSLYLEMKQTVQNTLICNICGHTGRLNKHNRLGCRGCSTNLGCLDNGWKLELLNMKAEVNVREKAMTDLSFPNEDVVREFLWEPDFMDEVDLQWHQPNIGKFICDVAPILDWSELYAFQKFFPVLTRWLLKSLPGEQDLFHPDRVIKKRIVKGIPSVEVHWDDRTDLLNRFVPDDQQEEYAQNNQKSVESLLCTVEPLSLIYVAHPELIDNFVMTLNQNKKKKAESQGLPIGPGVRVITPLKNIKNKVIRHERHRAQIPRNTVPSDLDSDDEEPFTLNTTKFMVEYYVNPQGNGEQMEQYRGAQLVYESSPSSRDEVAPTSAQSQDGCWNAKEVDRDELKEVIKRLDNEFGEGRPAEPNDGDGPSTSRAARQALPADGPNDGTTSSDDVGAEGAGGDDRGNLSSASLTEQKNRELLTQLIEKMETTNISSEALVQWESECAAQPQSSTNPFEVQYPRGEFPFDDIFDLEDFRPQVASEQPNDNANESSFITDLDEENPLGDVFEEAMMEYTQCDDE